MGGGSGGVCFWLASVAAMNGVQGVSGTRGTIAPAATGRATAAQVAAQDKAVPVTQQGQRWAILPA